MGFPLRNGSQNAKIISFNESLHLFKHGISLTYIPPTRPSPSRGEGEGGSDILLFNTFGLVIVKQQQRDNNEKD